MQHFLIFTLLAGLALNACKHHEGNSSTKVTNGLEIAKSEAPYVVMLLLDNDVLCTGAWVSPHKILTAAHCLKGKSDARIVEPRTLSALFGYKTLAIAKRLVWNKQYQRPDDIAHDLGVLDFSGADLSSLAGTSIVSIADKPPKAGDEVTLVGFGNNLIDKQLSMGSLQQSGQGPLRAGVNNIDKVLAGHFVLRGFLSRREAENNNVDAGFDAGAAAGDSGGPVLDASGQVVGVISAGQPVVRDFDQVTAVDSMVVDLTSAAARDFLRSEQLIK